MKLRLTKTNKIIFAVSIAILSAALGFLIWRVNQQEQLSPEEGEAAYGQVSICRGDTVNESEITKITTYNIKNGGLPSRIGPFPKDAKVVLYYKSLLSAQYQPKIRFSYGGTNYDYVMTVSDQGNKRGVINTDIVITSEGDYIDLVWSDDNSDQGSPACSPMDQPLFRSFGWMPLNPDNTCGSGFAGPPTQGGSPPLEKVSVSSDIQWAEALGNPIVSKQCWADWREWLGDYDFNDYFLMVGYELTEEENKCDGGTWETKPSGNINYGIDVPWAVKNTDPDGVGSYQANLYLDDVSVSDDDAETPSAIPEDIMSGVYTNLEPGNYNLTIIWTDGKGASSAECEKTTSFVVLEEPTNPDWTISKEVVGQCIDEGTENPSAKLEYKVTVKNIGDGVGSYTEIEDELSFNGSALPSGVQVTNIQPAGTYSGSKITWASKSLEPGQELVLQYEITLSKEYFGLFTNTVTLILDSGDDDPNASASINIDCEELIPDDPPPPPPPPEDPEVPETGLLDSTLGKVALGIVLLMIGGTIQYIPNKVFALKGGVTRYRYRDRFEKKVDKR
jgi:hypothetical protein